MTAELHWMLMAGGIEQPLDPDFPPRYCIETIAHHLAQINRFTGATCRPYSVAEHSLLCADLAAEAGCDRATQLACLMHDAHEAVVGDVSTPTKHQLGNAWHAYELRHCRALRQHFGLRDTYLRAHTTVRQMDLIALATERRDLLGWDAAHHLPWPILDKPGHAVHTAPVDLLSLWRTQRHWSEWRDAFLARFDGLASAATYTCATTTTATGAAHA